MSTALDILGVVGTAASLGGAYLAFREARKSKNAAKVAEAARDGVLQIQSGLRLAQVWADGQRAQEVSRALLTVPTKPLRGTSYDKMLTELQTHADLLQQSTHLILKDDRDAYTRTLKTLTSALENMRSIDPQHADYRNRSMELHSSLVSCSATIRRHMDSAT